MQLVLNGIPQGRTNTSLNFGAVCNLVESLKVKGYRVAVWNDHILSLYKV